MYFIKIIFFIIFIWLVAIIEGKKIKRQKIEVDEIGDDGSQSVKNYTIFYPNEIVAHVAIILKHPTDTGYLYLIDISDLDNKQTSFYVNNNVCVPNCSHYVDAFTIINLYCTNDDEVVQILTTNGVSTLSIDNCSQQLNLECLTSAKTCVCDSDREGSVQDNCRRATKTDDCSDKKSSTELTTSATTPDFYLTPLDFYTFFFTGYNIEFTIQTSYSAHTGAYVFHLEPIRAPPQSSIIMGTDDCSTKSCTQYANNNAFINIMVATHSTNGNITMHIDNFATSMALNDCEQTFMDRQCKTQFGPYWCICHTKLPVNLTPASCDASIPLSTCSGNTPPPNSRVDSFHVGYGSDAFSGFFMDVLYYNGQYDYIVDILPDTSADIYVNDNLCSVHCDLTVDDNVDVIIRFGNSVHLKFRGSHGKCQFYYEDCLQTFSASCFSDFSMLCICKTFPLTFETDDVNPMCSSAEQFQTCSPSSTITTKLTTFPSTLSSTIATTHSTTISTTQLSTSKSADTSSSAPTTHPTFPSIQTTKSLPLISTVPTIKSTPPTTKTTKSTTPPPTTSHTTTVPPIPSLTNLTDSGVSLDNVTYVLSVTMEYTENATTLQATDISDVSTILTNSASLQGLPSTDANLILQNIDNVLNAHDEQIEKSQSQDKFLSILPTLVLNTKSSQVQYLNGNNMGFSSGNVQHTSVNGLTDQGDAFQTLNNTFLPQNHKNSIVLHAGQNGNLPSGTKAFFTIFRSKKFFNSQSILRNYPTYTHSFMQTNDLEDALQSKCVRQFQLPLDSPVMSATVIQPDGYRISKLASYNMSAQLHLSTENLLPPLHGRMIVSWWKTEINKWSTDDLCAVDNKNHLITATCDHLTDFALIIDSMVNDPVVCDSGLIDVGYVVNVLSLTCLIIIIFIQFTDNIPFLARQRFLQKLKGPPLQKSDHMQMAHNIMLFLFYLFFLIFSNQSISGKGCNFVAAVIYSLLLCSIILTIFQSLRTVILFFPTGLHNLINGLMRPFVALTLGFIVPFLLCLILAATTPFFNRQDGFCWVRPDFIVYAIVIPVSILIINGIICTALVAWRLFSAGFKFNRIGRAHDTHMKTKLLALFILQFTMGMPWVLQYPTLYHSNTTFWHYAFSIVLGSQGTILAILYFYKNHRRWRESVRISGRQLRVRNVTSPTLETRASS